MCITLTLVRGETRMVSGPLPYPHDFVRKYAEDIVWIGVDPILHGDVYGMEDLMEKISGHVDSAVVTDTGLGEAAEIWLDDGELCCEYSSLNHRRPGDVK